MAPGKENTSQSGIREDPKIVGLTERVVSSAWEDWLEAAREPERPSQEVSWALRFLIASCRAWLSIISSRFSRGGNFASVALTSLQPVGTLASLGEGYPQGSLSNQHLGRPQNCGSHSVCDVKRMGRYWKKLKQICEHLQ